MEDEPDRGASVTEPAARTAPASIGWAFLAMMITLLVLLIVLGSNFQSSPYSERQLMLQPIALFGALGLFLANLLAFGFPKMRLPVFGVAALFLLLLFLNNGI